jgi:hypothetical protein
LLLRQLTFSSRRELVADMHIAVKMAGDVVEIRSRYIQDNLRRALIEGDRLMAWIIVAEFRRYFHWFADTLPERDKRLIAEQLSRLEALYAVQARFAQSGLNAR